MLSRRDFLSYFGGMAVGSAAVAALPEALRSEAGVGGRRPIPTSAGSDDDTATVWRILEEDTRQVADRDPTHGLGGLQFVSKGPIAAARADFPGRGFLMNISVTPGLQAFMNGFSDGGLAGHLRGQCRLRVGRSVTQVTVQAA
jgi:hypothetical protein